MGLFLTKRATAVWTWKLSRYQMLSSFDCGLFIVCMCGGQRTACKTGFSPLTLLVLGTELRSPGFWKSAFPC